MSALRSLGNRWPGLALGLGAGTTGIWSSGSMARWVPGPCLKVIRSWAEARAARSGSRIGGFPGDTCSSRCAGICWWWPILARRIPYWSMGIGLRVGWAWPMAMPWWLGLFWCGLKSGPGRRPGVCRTPRRPRSRVKCRCPLDRPGARLRRWIRKWWPSWPMKADGPRPWIPILRPPLVGLRLVAWR